MARKNSQGKYILSAGEIGVYTVCPESWRLKILKGLRGEHSESVEKGASMHKKWAEEHAEAIFFARGAKIIFAMISFAIILAGVIL